jgi:hypothetical protein
MDAVMFGVVGLIILALVVAASIEAFQTWRAKRSRAPEDASR